MMIDDNHEKTFVVKMAVSSNDENELLRFLSIAIDDENQSFSFDNLISLIPELMMIARNPILYLLKWRLENWGVPQDCENCVKNVKNTDQLFNNHNHRYTEYLQYTSLFNVPIKLFLEMSNYFNNLQFELVFIRNDLDICGRVIIEDGQIIEKTLVNSSDWNQIDLLLIANYMYDENYSNQSLDEILLRFAQRELNIQ